MPQPLRIADRIDAEAHKLRFGRTLLAIITAPLYGLSWIVSKLLLGVWRVISWLVAAVKVGWQDARR